jgi:hypothetical protein
VTATVIEHVFEPYFVSEFSVESAALFNPSMVADPDQQGQLPGALRFVLSLRSTGDGSVSSIVFRTGIIHADHRIEVMATTASIVEPSQIPARRTRRPSSSGNFWNSG